MFILFGVLLSTVYAHGQIICGTVTDNRKEPIVNASVSVSQNGVVKRETITDFDGKYSMTLADTGSCEVSFAYMGFWTKCFDVYPVSTSQRTTLDVVLAETSKGKFYCPIVCIYHPPLINRFGSGFKIHPWQIKGYNR